MTAQFWWGLAMLPLGTLALAITIFLPWLIIAFIGDRRQKHGFFTRWDGNRRQIRRLAAYTATADKAITIRGPVGWKLAIIRDAPGSTPRNYYALTVVSRIEDAIENAEKEAE